MKMHELKDRLLGPAVQPVPQDRYQQPWVSFAQARQTRIPGDPVQTRTPPPVETERRPNFVNQLVHLKDAAPEVSGGAVTQEPAPAEMNPPESLTNAVPQQAVAELFRLSGDFEERISELGKALESIEAITQFTSETFAPLRAFQEQIAQLARTFEPMRAFCEQLSQMSRTFAPMKVLHEQIVRIPEEFRAQLLRFAKSLEPVKAFRARVEGLAREFQPVEDLETRFIQLAESFRIVSTERPAAPPERSPAASVKPPAEAKIAAPS
jgi:hypothetical protein